MRKLRKNSKEYKLELGKFMFQMDKSIWEEDDYYIRYNYCDGSWKFNYKTIAICKISAEEANKIEIDLKYNTYYKRSIFDAYGRPSDRKIFSFEELEKVYKDWDVKRITGYNCNRYTYCATLSIEGSTGYLLFAKETSCSTYLTIYIVE